MGPGDLGPPGGIASDNMAPPAWWKEIDRSVMPEFAPVFAVGHAQVLDCSSQSRLLGEAEWGLFQQGRRVFAGVAVPARGQTEVGAVVTIPQLMTAVDQRCHLLAGNPP